MTPLQRFTQFQQACSLMGNPERSFPCVLIGGTNGKGSTSTHIARALEKGGYKVGLFTSPHIWDKTERIQIQSLPIPEQEWEEYKNQLPYALSFFEEATLIAFLYFQKNNIDIAILEVGLGGRFDATNVCSPLLSVITSLDYDHQDILGNTLEEIAYAKAGIIKPCTPLVLGNSVIADLFHPYAKKANAPLWQPSAHHNDYQEENKATSALCLELLHYHFPISSQAKEQGLQTLPPCRFMRIAWDVPLIADVAHNPQGLSKLFQKLHITHPGHIYHAIVTLSYNKDIASCMALLENKAHALFLPKISHPRLATPSTLMSYTQKLPTLCTENLADALLKARTHSSTQPLCVIVTGSFFVMETLYQCTRIKQQLS